MKKATKHVLQLIKLRYSKQSLISRQTHFHTKPISTLSSQCLEDPQEPQQHYVNTYFTSLADHPDPEISCFYQKGFSQITKISTGKALHGLCVKGLVRVRVFCNNTLIYMYSKFGLVGAARKVFDGMREKNEASWNNLMSGFVKLGMYRQAFDLFCEMLSLGYIPCGVFVASLITGCGRSGVLVSEGVQVHGFVVKIGLLNDVFVSTSLMHFYGMFGFVNDARKLFEEMPDKNVVSWTSLMVNYLDSGNPVEVIELYRDMRRGDVSCNENTFATVITSCGLMESDLLGYQVLGHVIKFGFEHNVSVSNSLVSMFGNFGRVEQARSVFDSMPERNTISWNSILSVYVNSGLCDESLRLFNWMRFVHEEINTITVSTLLSGFGSAENLKWGRGIHSLVVKLGLDSDVCVSNTLLGMYSDAGSSEDAEFVFQQMQEKDSISWNSLMSCYIQDGKSLDALKIFADMVMKLKIANYVSFTTAFSACLDPVFVIHSKIVHALAVLTGLQKNLVVGNALLTMYTKQSRMVEAKKVFQTMSERDKVTWNILIRGHAENEESDEAIESFISMRENGLFMDYITIANVLAACSVPDNLLKHGMPIPDNLLKHGMPIHAHIVSTGFESHAYVRNSLIIMYAKCGDLDSSKYLFDGLADKNTVSWNAMIAANALHGHGEEIVKLIVGIRESGLELDQFSFSEGLAATAKLALLEEGQQLHCLAMKLGFDADLFITNAAMDMYGKCGEINDVLRVSPQPMKRARMTWNILISVFARHGYYKKAKETFQEMSEHVNPDRVTFISLLSACNHGGLVEEGLAYYKAMTEEFGVPADIEHCVCIVDLLGRAGRFSEAENFINEMPIPPHEFVWRSLLASCKIHGNLDLARKAAEQILELNPSDDSAHVLYSNLCATTGRWDDVENVRKQMDSNKIKKQPACSWVKLKDEVSSFGMGDKSHPQTEQIYSKLEELKKMIKEAGYVTDTSYALHDTDEEQKEQNLWDHSERLALAFSLIRTPEKYPIRVFKNLRVCGDCHLFYKFISKIIQRRIILRDPYRFHHFSSGECSCSDYW